ncbi:uncharacterized protein FTOL_00560 [Fusarium torulosum]|uniref:Uncharacterized protein n=1 Tax=Fusarium torulosum TaxID=33205 RepID=A0AAE8SCV6_9HYPO|nr:uncharacterized protein FTOL_00560 [Fusarium torulosum]
MLDKEEICWPSTFCSYFLVAIAQIVLVLVAAAHHAKIREVNTFLYRRYKETSVCIGVIALMLIVVQLYISIIVTSIQGPRTIIYWLGCAQLMVTLYFLHLPFEYSSEISKDERFLVDNHFTDEEEVIFSTRIDSAASEGYPGFEYYGTIVPQLSGPGGASPVSADEVLVGIG